MLFDPSLLSLIGRITEIHNAYDLLWDMIDFSESESWRKNRKRRRRNWGTGPPGMEPIYEQCLMSRLFLWLAVAALASIRILRSPCNNIVSWDNNNILFAERLARAMMSSEEAVNEVFFHQPPSESEADHKTATF